MKTSSVILALICLLCAGEVFAQSRVEQTQIRSASFAHSRVGISPVRKLNVYLPPDYANSAKRFPVIYSLNNFYEDETAPFANNGAQAVFDAAIKEGLISEVIVVTADFTTPLGTSWYVNSAVTGNWEDFMVSELVPWVDVHYKTLPRAASRGIAGDRVGGYGAIRFGMTHPEVFGSVYALHPVGTGNGVQSMHSRPDWDALHGAKSIDDLKSNIFGPIFTSMYQAFLPNPESAPLYVDLPAKRVNGELVTDAQRTARLQSNFLLEHQLAQNADNLKKLRAFKFDWGRNDANYDHVYSNQAFAHKLEEYGVVYEAEEYRGWWGERHWGNKGRVMTDMLPFFARNLDFE